MTALEILRALVAIRTPSAVSNVPLLEWVHAFLQERGWHVELLRYDDEKGVPKANLIARAAGAGAGELIDLAFVCHTDTVPFADDWTEALALQERAGMAHGCGACDVKGSLACFLSALSVIEPKEIRGSVALLLTADEEIGCKGMERLLAATDLRIRSAIVSEPTSLRPGIAGKGYGLVRVRVQGREAHSAFPGEGVSAIDVAADFLTALKMRSKSAQTDELFEPAHTTVNVGVIEGGTAKNILAGSCSFLVEWRPIPGDAPQRMQAELESLAAEMEQRHAGARIAVEAMRAEPGFAPAAEGPLLQQLTALCGETRRPFGISFGSEASRLARIADEVIVIGPGDMHTAHSDRECVPVAELEEWTAVLRTLLTAPAKG